MQKPFFSVIIPTYNRAKFLQIALASVLAQTFHDYEIILVDDGSTDDTYEMLQKMRREAQNNAKDIKYFHQENKGPAAARNLGIKQATGDFICLLDSDDRFRDSKLKISYEHIKKYPQYKIFHTEEIWYKNGALLSQKIYHKKPSGKVFENAVRMCSIGTSTAVIRKGVFDAIGLFDEAMPACEDYDFWLRVTNRYEVFLIPHYLTIKEGGRTDQLSLKYPAMDTFRIYALKKILESKELSGDNFRIAADELKRKCNIFIKGALKRGKTKEANSYKLLMEKF
ncbi:MAG: glycosyltransferase family A protein [Candidatus Omnitrophica bacterium]|nr:glycosyltransferase family A protein [Candidatus Omnitrophota bacterium]